jgi:CRP/FNR family transcriptional regulator
MLTHDSSKLGSCTDCVIRDRGICGSLAEDELLDFKYIAGRRTYQPGERILSDVDGNEFLGAIYSGVIKVTGILKDGRQQIVGLLFSPNCLGHMFCGTSTFVVEAATHVEICCFDHRAFERLSGKYSSLNKHLLNQTLDELDAAQDWMVLLGQKTAEEKVATLLLRLVTQSSSYKGNGDNGSTRSAEFELHLNREEIAEFLGLTYETVCRRIAVFKKRNIVRFYGTRRFSIPDLDALAALAGSCP